MDKQQKTYLKWGIIALLVLIIVIYPISTYNSLVNMDESINNAWAQVENQYQRRADLIPNLIATVQGAADFESNTQTEIAALRTQATTAKQAWDSASTQQEQIAAAQQVDAVATKFSGLNINVENYPQLKATQNFETFQAQLEGTENRVSVERQRYNDAVRSLNTKVRKFPANIFANMFGFDQREYFEIEEGTQEVPQVSFN
jgi:LemA protein